MLFMVIETYPHGDYAAVGERFRRLGRMLPEGVEYVDSWIDLTGTRCFQLMEAPRLELIQEWTKRWGPVATPLLWSHAMYVTLATELGVL